MGVSVHYVAIPPISSLYQRAQKEKPLAVMVAGLFLYGSTIYRFFDIDADEREEILESLTDDYPEVMTDERVARRWMNEFRREVEQTKSAYPGIESRFAWLEKTSEAIEQRLKEAWIGDANKTPLVDRLIAGDRAWTDHFVSGWSVLSVATAALVQRGAEVLGGLDAVALFGKQRDEKDQFLQWRKLYQQASAHGEEMLVGVS